MTVSSTTRRNDYDGSGSTATYAYTYYIANEDYLLLTVKVDATGVETTLTKTTHYTVTGVGELSGGNIVLVNGNFSWIDGSGYLDTGYSLTIRRVVPLTQLVDIRNQGTFFPETHEDTFDYLTFIAQQQQDELDRAIKLGETSSLTGVTFPEPGADKYIKWNSLGTSLETASLSVTSGTFPGDFSAGVDASKAASPSTNDVYIATDTLTLYICFSAGTWTSYGQNIGSGLDASKSATPAVGDVYIATDTFKVYVCYATNTWSTKRVFDTAVDWAKGADLASASTVNIGAAAGNFVHITGTTTVTAFDTVQAGTIRIIRFAGALTLTHNATSLILPSAANITTAANDTAVMVSEGSGNWRCISYTKADGTALVPVSAASQAEMESASSLTVYASPGRVHYHPGVVKAWGTFDGTAGTPAISTGYNMESTMTDDGAGLYTVSITNDLSSSAYAVIGTSSRTNGGSNNTVSGHSKAVGSFQLRCIIPSTDTAGDPVSVDFAVLGDI